MTVPRINVGVDVLVPKTILGREQTAKVWSVDFPATHFQVTLDTKYVLTMRFQDYYPAPTMNNFLRALGEWDYFYRMSDDPRLWEEGKEMEAALVKLFKGMSKEDQHVCQKMIDIVAQTAIKPAGE